MQSADFIIIALIALIIGAAVGYIVNAKRKGKKCIGCPYECSCKSRSCCEESKDIQ